MRKQNSNVCFQSQWVQGANIYTLIVMDSMGMLLVVGIWELGEDMYSKTFVVEDLYEVYEELETQIKEIPEEIREELRTFVEERTGFPKE